VVKEVRFKAEKKLKHVVGTVLRGGAPGLQLAVLIKTAKRGGVMKRLTGP